MRYLAVVCDYDGTLATDGLVPPVTLDALRQVKESGRKLVLVTGREVEDLLRVFHEADLFDLIVAENGGLLYNPASKDLRLLAEAVPEALAAHLRMRGVSPLLIGRVLVATQQSWESEVLHSITELGLKLQVIFNKGAVMVLPSGVNKASGLQAALTMLGVSIHNAVGIGDAENDHAFLSACECAAAVGGALPMVKERADLVMTSDNGAGVAELCAQLLRDDLRSHEPSLHRHHLLLGLTPDQQELHVPAYGVNLLMLGPPGSGKSTLAAGLIEQAMAQGYQCCIVDPEGDYELSAGMVVFGDANTIPRINHIQQMLRQPGRSALVNLSSVPVEQRPAFFEMLLPMLLALRRRAGSPHWIVVDEAHHVLPNVRPAMVLEEPLHNMVLMTVEASRVTSQVLAMADIVLAAGDPTNAALREFGRLVELPVSLPGQAPTSREVVCWKKIDGSAAIVRPVRTRSDRCRRRRTYAQGDIGPERSFYFRGPHGALNVQAKNLMVFLQVAATVDRATWLFHLRRHDYSHWFRNTIRDRELADEAERVESNRHLSPENSRALMSAAIQQRYALPETGFAGLGIIATAP